MSTNTSTCGHKRVKHNVMWTSLFQLRVVSHWKRRNRDQEVFSQLMEGKLDYVNEATSFDCGEDPQSDKVIEAQDAMSQMDVLCDCDCRDSDFGQIARAGSYRNGIWDVQDAAYWMN